jgi:hypothetical protein
MGLQQVIISRIRRADLGVYDEGWLYLNAWGERKRMSWKFFLRHCDEIWALVSRQHWTGVSGLSPEGEALDHLVSEMQASVR